MYVSKANKKRVNCEKKKSVNCLYIPRDCKLWEKHYHNHGSEDFLYVLKKKVQNIRIWWGICQKNGLWSVTKTNNKLYGFRENRLSNFKQNLGVYGVYYEVSNERNQNESFMFTKLWLQVMYFQN